ncbi:hypothetical protein KIPB_001341 [Kipferlia bialata]|uniref:Uncharacterized protein n=1 Tax=Kipferlia bialata TaxID=797122 RepID=A0A9K3CNU3_9EUKA|nr:hypothetical protein KIPB_001341 [Kipferlia bialata]|eukprot:g1341.t1
MGEADRYLNGDGVTPHGVRAQHVSSVSVSLILILAFATVYIFSAALVVFLFDWCGLRPHPDDRKRAMIGFIVFVAGNARGIALTLVFPSLGPSNPKILVWVGCGLLVALGIILLRLFSFADWSIIIVATLVGFITIFRMLAFVDDTDTIDPFSKIPGLDWVCIAVLCLYPFLAMLRDKAAHRMYRYHIVCHIAYLAEDSLRSMVVLSAEGGKVHQFRPDELEPPCPTIPEYNLQWLQDMRLITAIAISGAAIAHNIGRLQGMLAGFGAIIGLLSVNLGSWAFAPRYGVGYTYDWAFTVAILISLGVIVVGG